MTTKEIDTDADERPVVVGVTGPRDNDAALRFAADEARRLGVGVSIVHAVHGRRPVDEALEMFRSRYGDVEATALVRHGHPVKVLTELSSSARMVVLQHRELSSLHRIFTGSTLMGVAATQRVL